MKVIVLIKATHESEAGILPDAKTLADIATLPRSLRSERV